MSKSTSRESILIWAAGIVFGVFLGGMAVWFLTREDAEAPEVIMGYDGIVKQREVYHVVPDSVVEAIVEAGDSAANEEAIADFDFPGNNTNDPAPRKEELSKLPPTPDVEPQLLNMKELRAAVGYPKMALAAEIEGKVVLQIRLDDEGEYLEHTVLQNPHPLLTSS